MATFGHFVQSWTYHKQYAFFTATLCAYVQLAPVFTNPVAGMLCNMPIGWPGVYYVHSLTSAALFVTFFFCYRYLDKRLRYLVPAVLSRNDPNRHPYVNDVEKSKIARGRDALDALAQKHVPYR